MNYVAKYCLQLIRLLARLGDVLTDESVEDEFSCIICLNSGFIPKRGIRLMQMDYQSQTCNSSQTDN